MEETKYVFEEQEKVIKTNDKPLACDYFNVNETEEERNLRIRLSEEPN